jgi:hypothetical protein
MRRLHRIANVKRSRPAVAERIRTVQRGTATVRATEREISEEVPPDAAGVTLDVPAGLDVLAFLCRIALSPVTAAERCRLA